MHLSFKFCCITHFTITTCTCLSHSQPAPVFHTHHLHLSTFTHRASIKPLSTDVFWEFSNVHSKHFHACVSVWLTLVITSVWLTLVMELVKLTSSIERPGFNRLNHFRAAKKDGSVNLSVVTNNCGTLWVKASFSIGNGKSYLGWLLNHFQMFFHWAKAMFGQNWKKKWNWHHHTSESLITAITTIFNC